MTYLADCAIGCFEGAQQVGFAGGPLAIQEAVAQRLPSVVALAEGSSASRLRWDTTDIKEYTVGDFAGEMVQVTAENGRRIVVTPNHSLFMADGEVRQAVAIRAGDEVLGEPSNLTVQNVARVPYKGIVYNIRPVSSEVVANTNLSEGFVTGSVRFQNEWAREDFRLALRQRLDVNQL